MSTGTCKSCSHGAMEFQLQKHHVKCLIRETVFCNGRSTDLVHRERLALLEAEKLVVCAHVVVAGSSGFVGHSRAFASIHEHESWNRALGSALEP